jgi:KAP family P-loop domain
MAEVQQKSSPPEPDSARAEPDSARGGGSRTARIAYVTATEIGLPLLFATILVLVASVAGWRRISINQFRQDQVDAMNDQAWVIMTGNNQLPLDDLKPGQVRTRLGDAVYAENPAQARISVQLAAPGRQFFVAAIYDDRLLLSMPGASKARATGASLKIAPQWPPPPRLMPVGYAAPPPKEEFNAAQMPPPNASAKGSLEQMPAEASKPQEQKVAPETYNPREQMAAPKTYGERTIPQIVTSATMMALLEADSRGATSVLLAQSLWSQPGLLIASQALAAMSTGLEQVANHLSSIQRVDLVGKLDRAPARVVPHEQWPSDLPAAFLNLLSTPLPFPGGADFTKPRRIDLKAIPQDAADLINFAYRVSGRTTIIPAIAFLIVATLAVPIGMRRLRLEEIKPLGAGFLAGIGLTAGLAAFVFVVGHFWRWCPDRWPATVPGLLFVALVAGAAHGGLMSRLRALAVPRTSPVKGRDRILRSVLYRDTPVEDLAHDKLGFASLVDALRRFLDNPDTAPPVVLSVNGPWGSGKSSIMKMLAAELRKTARFRIVWFNAWQYHSEEQILAAFLQTIARRLAADWGAVFAIRLGWARWKDSGPLAQFLTLAPFALLIVGLLRPDLRASLSGIPGKLAEGHLEALIPAVALGGFGAYLIWGATVLWPFRLHFRKLFGVEDQSARIGFIDRFTREFRLYREAVGSQQKFLFIIDDLDRCPPDRVVDVLKAINMIVTSSDEAGRSFFILGYDQSYIVRAIELHFKELAEMARARGERFGPQYLKKMVTISVSVPRPTPDAIRSLVEGVDREDARREGENAGAATKLAEWINSAPTRMAQMATVIAAVGIFAVVLSLPSTTPPAPQPPPPTNQRIEPGPSGEGQVVEMPPPPTLPSSSPAWWQWLFPAGVVLLAGAVLVRVTRMPEVEEAYRREPKDSTGFLTGVERCKELLPLNPRDAVRLVNLMRMEFLIQESEQAPFSGHPLGEWECVSYTVLRNHDPIFFDPNYVQEKVIPALTGKHDSSADPPGFYREIGSAPNAGTPANGADLAAAMDQLIKAGGHLHHMLDPEKLRRYVEVNRFIADGGN